MKWKLGKASKARGKSSKPSHIEKAGAIKCLSGAQIALAASNAGCKSDNDNKANVKAISPSTAFSELSIDDLDNFLKALDQKDLLLFATNVNKKLNELYKAVAIMNKLAAELDIHKAIDSIRSFILELLACESVTLFLVDSENKSVRARIKGVKDDWSIISTAMGEGIAGSVAQTGRSMNIPDAYACKIFNPTIDRATNFVTKSVLCCPIADISGKRVAVVQAVNKIGGSPFSPGDEDNLKLFSVHLGNTLTKSRLYASILFEKQRLEMLNDGIREINAPFLSLDNLVVAINRSAFSVLQCEQSMLFFCDSGRSQLWTRWEAWTTLEESLTTHCTVASMEAGLIGKACARGEAQSCRDTSPEGIGLPATFLDVEQVRCALVQPILDIRTSKILAVVCAVNKRFAGDSRQSALFSEPKYTINDLNAMAVFAIEVSRVLSDRSLEISFANALSTVSSVGEDQTAVDAALQMQLMTYAGLDEIEAVGGPLLVPDAAITPDLACRPSLTSASPKNSANRSPQSKLTKQTSLSDSLERETTVPLRATLKMKSQRLRQWDLDIHFSSNEDLMAVVFDIFVDAGILSHFKIEERSFMIWVSRVMTHYRDNPYHNFHHVVHVLHTVYLILMTTEAARCLTRLDQLALLIAALCHDIDHDGKTNGFHIACSTDLARCYNDNSVLENHHCALTFDLINKCNLLSHLEKGTQQELRRIVIGAILATDMSFHFSLTTEFKNRVKFSHKSPEDRLLLSKTILHAADLSNPTLPFAINSYISQNVHAEFKLQVKEELARGMTPMPHMNAKDERVQCLLEISFIDAVVLPLWEHLALLFPALKPCLDQIVVNRTGFQRLTARRTMSIKQELLASYVRT